jgi:hypothetical protein
MEVLSPEARVRRQTVLALLAALPFISACGSTEPDEADGTQTGTLKWTTASSTGSCAMSLTTSKQADLLRTTGTLCGQTVDQTNRLTG